MHPRAHRRTTALRSAAVFAALLCACGGGEVKVVDPIDDFEPVNAPPTASAGLEQTVQEGATVVLIGDASRDPDGTVDGFLWEVVSGGSVSLANASSSTTTFLAPEVSGNNDATDIIVRLTVTDNDGLTASDTTKITVFDTNRRPTVSIAAIAVEADAFTQITLDASDSDDADGTISTFAWTQTTGTEGTIDTPDMAVTTVTLPDTTRQELVTFEIEITDDAGKTSSDVVALRVNPKATQLGFPDLGDPAQVEVDVVWQPLRVEILNASGERISRSSVAALDITLERFAGTGVLSGTLERTARSGGVDFTDLSYNVIEDGVQLRAYVDGEPIEGLSPDINVRLTNPVPVVNASTPNATVSARTSGVQLNATVTDDTTIATLAWVQLSGPSVTITDDDTENATFNAPDVTEPTGFLFELRATDNGGKTGTGSVGITVTPVGTRLRFVSPLPTPVPVDGQWTGVNVEVLNQSGERITDGVPATYDVRLDVLSGTGTPAQLGGTLDTVAAAGVAAFPDISYGELISGLVLQPSIPSIGLTGVPSSAVDVIAKVPGGIGAPGAQAWWNDAAAASGSAIALGGGFSTDVEGLDFGFARVGDPRVSAGAVDGTVAHYAGDGTLNWVRTIGGTNSTAEVMALSTSATGVIAGVNHTGGVDFDDGAPNVSPPLRGGDDVALAHYDGGSGALDWAVSFGDSLSERITDVHDATNLWVTGTFTGTGVDFEPCSGSSPATADGITSGFVATYDTSAFAACSSAATLALWTPPVAAADNSVDAIAVGAGGEVFIAGTFAGDVEIVASEPLTPSAGAQSHAYVAQLSAGVAVWATAFGGDTGVTSVADLHVDADNNLWVTGITQSGGDFAGKALSVNGDVAAYVASFDDTGALRANQTFAIDGFGGGDAVAVAAIGSGPSSADPVLVSGAWWGSVSFDGAGGEIHAARFGESNGFVLVLEPDATLRSLNSTGALGGGIGTGLDNRLGAMVITAPSGNVTALVAGDAGGGVGESDIAPAGGVRRYIAFGDLDATLTRLTP